MLILCILPFEDEIESVKGMECVAIPLSIEVIKNM